MTVDGGFVIQFLLQFASQGLLLVFAFLYLAARELPVEAGVMVACLILLRAEETRVLRKNIGFAGFDHVDDGCHDVIVTPGFLVP